MKVRVTPRDREGLPIEGAGSWIAEAEKLPSAIYKLASGDLENPVYLPPLWIEEIPEIVPEPGDICMDRVGELFIFKACFPEEDCMRVLARKPREYDAILPDLLEWAKNFPLSPYKNGNAEYASLLSLILGGAKMGRVE